MVANLPLEHVRNTILSCLSPLEVQATAHRITHRIENHHRWLGQLKHVLYIIRANGGTKTELGGSFLMW